MVFRAFSQTLLLSLFSFICSVDEKADLRIKYLAQGQKVNRVSLKCEISDSDSSLSVFPLVYPSVG